jgi:phosphoribosylformimino-5-aminoimidazole carboxamide ribotide isomerase
VIIYPAIDLRKGRVVRLRQGNPNAESVFSENPAAMAQSWAEQGAQWLHIVNLDGALGAPAIEGEAALSVNLRALQSIRQAVALPLQFGGGLRSLDAMQLVFDLGVERIILGTVAVENPALLTEAIRRWGAERIVVGLDARQGKVTTHGWQSTTNASVIDVGHQMYALGVRRVLYTDVSRDGMMAGVNVKTTSRLADTTGLWVIASGGVSGLNDIEQLKRYEYYNIDGVIVGQALYTGALNLAEAIAISQRPLTRRSAGLIPIRHGKEGVEFLLVCNFAHEQWQFPRGCVEATESDLCCAQREFDEATGLPIVRLHEACRSELHYNAAFRGHTVQRTLVYYLAEIGEGPLALGNENLCEARWANTQETRQLLNETSPEQMPALEAALRYLERDYA